MVNKILIHYTPAIADNKFRINEGEIIITDKKLSGKEGRSKHENILFSL